MRKIFKTLVTLEEAIKKLYKYFEPKPLGFEEIPLPDAVGRVLAEDVYSEVDVPPFDRAAMDGYAVKAIDTFGAREDKPVKLKIVGKVKVGYKPEINVNRGEAAEIGTGAPMPSGANAVVMIEYTEEENGYVKIFKPVVPGENVQPTGSDIMVGELVLREGQLLTSREIGVLAAIGRVSVKVYRKPKVAIISTGDEIVKAGEKLPYGKIYDINGLSIFSAVKECGGEPIFIGIARDDVKEIIDMIRKGFEKADIVITSGSTSAGVKDVLYQIVDQFGKPGVIVHGIKIKPGKPTVIAIVDNKPLFGLPGYPTSALTIFRLIVAPVIRRMAGLSPVVQEDTVTAVLKTKIYAPPGRKYLVSVSLVRDKDGNLVAVPTPGGSGTITNLANADGYFEIPEDVEFVDEGETVQVKLFSKDIKLPDLVFIGSHCLGVDLIYRLMRKHWPNINVRILNVGSTGGFMAIKRGEADIAGVHLLDEKTGTYNIPFIEKFGLKDKAVLVRGYIREQGFIVTKGNPKKIRGFSDLLREDIRFINRNKGSGTRTLIDIELRKLAEKLGLTFEELTSKIKGYDVEAKTHSAVASAVLHGRADVGLGIKTVAEMFNLEFIPITSENYDFLISIDSMSKRSVQDFLNVLRSEEFKIEAEKTLKGIKVIDVTGKIIYEPSKTY
ncbi:MAG: molybdopterin biosynthesis protein [Candidatus Baldrarchaeia archaeon]